MSTYIVIGCTTKMQTRSSASASLGGINYDQAFRIATQAATDAGFTITTANKDAGLITATRGGNALLTYNNPAINITILDNDGRIDVNVASTIGGQLVDYGTTARTVSDFCEALQSRRPDATCAIQ